MTQPARKFESGALVVLNRPLGGPVGGRDHVPAGTELVVHRPLKPYEEGGLYSDDPYQCRRVDGASLPGPNGPSGTGVYKGDWLDAAPVVYRTEKHPGGWRVYGAHTSPEGRPVAWFDDEAEADLFRDVKNGQLARALRAAEAFISGFEDDGTQEGVGAILADLRAASSQLGA